MDVEPAVPVSRTETVKPADTRDGRGELVAPRRRSLLPVSRPRSRAMHAPSASSRGGHTGGERDALGRHAASENVEDRTAGGGGGGGGFGIGGLPLSGGALMLVVIASLLFGVNPLEILGVMGGSGPRPSSSRRRPRQASAPAGGASRVTAQGVRGTRAGRHRDVLDPDLRRGGAALHAAAHGAVPRPDVARRAASASAASGPVLLPGRSRGVPRHRVLRRAAHALRRARRLRVRLRDRARGRPPRAELARHDAEVRRAGEPRRRPRRATRCRCASSCRPIASPACGAPAPRSAACSIRATSSQASVRPRPSATTRSRSDAGHGRAGRLHPRHARSSAPGGSRPGSRPATREAATRSPRHNGVRLRDRAARHL